MFTLNLDNRSYQQNVIDFHMVNHFADYHLIISQLPIILKCPIKVTPHDEMLISLFLTFLLIHIKGLEIF